MNELRDEKEEYQRKLHSVMAMIGGFLGGYAVLTRMDLFGNAQTANMMYIVLNIVGRNFTDVLLRVCGMIIYMTGIAITVIWKNKVKHNIHYLAVCIDVLAIIILGMIPRSVSPVVALYTIFFAMAIQWNSFPGPYGFVSSTILSTNNLRLFTMGITEYIMGHDIKQLHKVCIYGRVLLFYHAGVLCSFFAVKVADVKGVWFGLIITLAAMIKIIGEERQPWVKREMRHVGECVRGRKPGCAGREI